MRIFGKDGRTPITSVDSWLRLAPPARGAFHWKDYASAKELARAWFPAGNEGPIVPREVSEVLASHELTRGASFDSTDARAESRVEFDGYAGNVRNSDLAFVCQVVSGDGASRRAAVSIEAKAYEAFGGTVQAAIRASEALRARGKTSYGVARARDLLRALLPPQDAADPAALGLQYQLLTATAGALAYAEQESADVAVLVIHEFVHAEQAKRDSKRLNANEQALADFMTRLSQGECSRLQTGVLAGPFRAPGSDRIPHDTPLLVGKARRELP